MLTIPKPCPKEFRDDVVRVALNREPGVRIKDIAADFGITESCLGNWLAQAVRDEGRRAGSITTELVELREAKKKRIRPLEHENVVLRRAGHTCPGRACRDSDVPARPLAGCGNSAEGARDPVPDGKDCGYAR